MPKKPPKQKTYEVTLKNSVLSEVTTTSGGQRENGKVSHHKMVLLGPEAEGTYNRFSCFAVHSKMAQSTNAKSKPVEGLYTDTDHPIRFYVMNTDVPRILISHAASYWLGLVKVLCDNKAPRVKRQVASIDKKSDFRAKSSPFRTSTSHTGSSSQKKQTTSKMVTSEKVHVPSPRMHSFEDAKIQEGKRCIRPRSGGDVDVSDGEQYTQEEPSATTGKEPKTSKTEFPDSDFHLL